MNNMWYHYTKHVQGHLCYETYRYFSEQEKEKYLKPTTFFPNPNWEEHIKNDCEEWADAESSGHNAGYRYSFEEITHPPLDWIQRQIQYTKDRIKTNQEYLEFLTALEFNII